MPSSLVTRIFKVGGAPNLGWGEFSIVGDREDLTACSALETLRLSFRASGTPTPRDGFRLGGRNDGKMRLEIEGKVVYEAGVADLDGEQGEGAGLDGFEVLECAGVGDRQRSRGWARGSED